MLRASSKPRLVKLGEARLASIDHHLVWRLNAFFVILGLMDGSGLTKELGFAGSGDHDPIWYTALQ